MKKFVNEKCLDQCCVWCRPIQRQYFIFFFTHMRHTGGLAACMRVGGAVQVHNKRRTRPVQGQAWTNNDSLSAPPLILARRRRVFLPIPFH